MPQLSLSLLGPFLATVNDKSLKRFRTKTAQALLIYLICEPETAHRREHLMALLWPGLPQKSAQANLRQSLYLLKQLLPELEALTDSESVPFLLTDRQSIQVNPEARLELDVTQFEVILDGPAADWPTAVALYRGDFLADFYLPDSAPFEEWVLARRQVLQRRVLAALTQLAEEALVAAELDTAEGYARRQIEIDSLNEAGYRLLMQALTLAGRRTEALTQYEALTQLLAQELGARPSFETTELYETILAEGTIEGIHFKIKKQPTLPRDMDATFPISGPAPSRPIFVGREVELARLMGIMEEASKSQGQVTFITGDAGSGKSSLLTAFADKASQSHEELVVLWGNCNAFSGRGDPYLPFRDIFTLLSGHLDTAWSADYLNREQALTLWRLLPVFFETVLDHGIALLDVLIPKTTLLGNIEKVYPEGHPLLERIGEMEISRFQEQPQLFEHTTSIFRHLAAKQPILLILDDLQWADSGSIDLLFHLGRRLANSRILVIGAYRLNEITKEKNHPLRPLLDEYRRQFGDVWLDLDQVRGWSFVNDYLNTEANNFDERFRKTLYERTNGHPLFTIELLRDLQARGTLKLDSDGRWTTTTEMDWETLPARIEGVIATRLGWLNENEREILNVAAIEGDMFTLQVVARVLGVEERTILRTLSRYLEKKHRLVRESSSQNVGQYRLTRFRFTHTLFQQVIYEEMSTGERRLLHGDVAAILEEIYESQTNQIAVQLARHFTEAGEDEKALPYLLQVGDEARQQHAFMEAIQHYEQARHILQKQHEYEQSARTLMKLGLTYHSTFDFERSRQAYDEGFRFRQEAGLRRPPQVLPSPPHALRISYSTIPTLDPARFRDTHSGRIINQLFSGLMKLTATFDVTPNVAQSWQILDDGRTYLFHLRDDVQWSDGQPVVAEDFVFGWHWRKEVGDRSYLVQAGMKALNARTLQFKLNQPLSFFLQYVAGFVFPLPQKAVSNFGDSWTKPENIVTNGTFQMESWVKNESLSLRRNPTYHDHFSGNVERIEYKIISEPIEELDLYQSEELDIAGRLNQLAPRQWQAALQQFGDDLNSLGLTTLFLYFDTSQPPFGDARVRRALGLACDRQKLAAEFEMGLQMSASGGFIPPGFPGHVSDIALPYDPELARQLLAEAGYVDGREFPNVSALVSRGWVEIAKSVFDSWQNHLGIHINLKIKRWEEVMRPKPIDSSQIFITAWAADYIDPDNFLRVALQNRLKWPHENYFGLVEKAKNIMDQSERLDLYRQAEEILVHEVPIIPLLYRRRLELVKPWIKLYKPGLQSDNLQKVVIEPH